MKELKQKIEKERRDILREANPVSLDTPLYTQKELGENVDKAMESFKSELIKQLESELEKWADTDPTKYIKYCIRIAKRLIVTSNKQ